MAFSLMPIIASAVEFDGSEPWPTGGDIVLTQSVIVDDAHVAAVAGWETLTINSGVRLSFSNGSVAATLNATVSGAGTIGAYNSCGLTLAGDNSARTGGCFFTNSAVTVAHEYGLGGASSGVAFCYFPKVTAGNTYGALDFRWEGQKAFTNHCPITYQSDSSYTGTKAMYLGSLAADEYFVQDANFIFYNPAAANRYLRFRNNTEFISGRFQVRYTGNPFWSSTDTDAVVRFSGTAKICIGFDTSSDKRVMTWLAHGNPATYIFGHTGGTRMDSFSTNVGRFVLEGDGLFADYLATGEPWGVKTWTPYTVDNSNYKSCYDLNGHDVVFHCISTANNTVTETSSGYYYVTSSIPATISLVGDANGADIANVAALELRDKASLTIDNNATNHFATRVSSPDGTLTVKSGALVYQWKGGWDGTAVVIEGGLVDAVSERSFSGGHSSLTMTGGKLCLHEGSPVVFAGAKIGAKNLAPGVYTVVQLKADAATADYVDGDPAATLSVDAVWRGWPTEPGEVAYVPAGMTVAVLDEDVEAVSRLGGIVLIGNDSVVNIANETVPLQLAAPISGSGQVRIIDNAVGVTLLGDNSELVSPGCFYIENSAVAVSNRFGLGSARTGAATVKFATQDRKLIFGLADSKHFTNEVALVCDQVGKGAFALIGSEASDEYLVQNADFTCRGFNLFDNRITVKGNLEFASGTFSLNGGIFFYGDQKANVKFARGCSVVNSASGLATIAFYGAGYNVGMHAIPVVDFGPRSVIGVRTIVREMCILKFSNAGLFADLAESSISYTTSGATQAAHGEIDFCGCDQTMGTLELHYSSPKVVKGSTQLAPYRSESPATLTLQTASPVLVRTQASFEGALGYRYAGAGTNLLCNLRSTSTGGFRVSSGVAGFDWGAAWGGTNIVVDGTGTLYVGADSALAFGAKATAKASGVTLTLKDSGKLYLEDGETFVGWATKDGEDIPRGTYTAANCDWIEGEGTLRVLHDHAGVVLIVR